MAIPMALDHLNSVCFVGLSLSLGTCETSQVLIAGVPGVFSEGSSILPHLLIGQSSMS